MARRIGSKNRVKKEVVETSSTPVVETQDITPELKNVEVISKPEYIDGKLVVSKKVEGSDVIYELEDLTTTKRPI